MPGCTGGGAAAAGGAAILATIWYCMFVAALGQLGWGDYLRTFDNILKLVKHADW
jgi:hypothetical protein